MRASSENLLLAALPRAARAAVASCGENVELVRGAQLAEPGRPLEHVHFPLDAAIALCADAPQSLGLGVVGFEGMLGIGLVLGSPEPEFRAQVQAAGRAWRIEPARFSRLLASQPALRQRLHRYAHVRLLQLAQGAVCQAMHLLEGRLASQLLAARDRARCDHIALTHDALAKLLGVRRAGVTLTASAWRRRAMVRYSRGDIHVLDVAALRAVACDCHAADLRIYARILGRAPE